MKLKLMADYQCFPIWALDGENIDPSTLGISSVLCEDLMNWADAYDATLNLDDPLASGFLNQTSEEEFKNEGHRLRERLQEELGGASISLVV